MKTKDIPYQKPICVFSEVGAWAYFEKRDGLGRVNDGIYFMGVNRKPCLYIGALKTIKKSMKRAIEKSQAENPTKEEMRGLIGDLKGLLKTLAEG